MGEAVRFSFDMLRDMAQSLAATPYVQPVVEDDALLELIDYDLHNQISYKADRMLRYVPGAAKRALSIGVLLQGCR